LFLTRGLTRNIDSRCNMMLELTEVKNFQQRKKKKKPKKKPKKT